MDEEVSGPTRDPWIEIPCGIPKRSPQASGPTRDPWIEIHGISNHKAALQPSGPTRDPWIEIEYVRKLFPDLTSGPTRDPWIEITYYAESLYRKRVGSHTGPVD